MILGTARAASALKNRGREQRETRYGSAGMSRDRCSKRTFDSMPS